MTPTFGLLVFFISYIHASPIAISIPEPQPQPQPQPQAVTASLSPSQPPQPGCTGTYNGIFGIAVMNISIPIPSTSVTSTSSDPSSSTGTEVERNPNQEDAISPSMSSTSCAAVPSVSIVTMAEVSQIGDGQVQGGMHTVPMTMTMTMSTMTMVPVSQIGDGQIQNPGPATTATAAATATTSDGGSALLPLPRTRRSVIVTSKPPTVLEQACGIETRGSTLPTTTSTATENEGSRPTPTPSSTGGSPSTFVSCLTNSTLRLRLTDSTLLDSRNRTGYIASNYQFQFDGPPQAGALYTTGWSVCPSSEQTGSGSGSTSDNVLALGRNTTFWQCLSGGFYNLYTEDWAAQCSPVQLRVVSLVEC